MKKQYLFSSTLSVVSLMMFASSFNASFASDLDSSRDAHIDCLAMGGSQGGMGSGGSQDIAGSEQYLKEISKIKAPIPADCLGDRIFDHLLSEEGAKKFSAMKNQIEISVSENEYREIAYQAIENGSVEIGNVNLKILSLDLTNKRLVAISGKEGVKTLVIKSQKPDHSDDENAIRSLLDQDLEELLIVE